MSDNERILQTIDRLRQIERDHRPVGFACSFGAEDMALLDLIARHARGIEVFTLDTGRLPEETHTLLDQCREFFPVPIRIYFPDSAQVEAWVELNGVNGFYRSVSQRKQCCHMRKVVPLARALSGKQAWMTGLRREQSAARQALAYEEWDEVHGMRKFNPLADWTLDDVWTYIRENGVPYNALHDRGYPSIGCAPCTRAVGPGEDIRAGRWWWEDANAKECGLHPHGETAGKGGA
ncbi:MAG TPA: phosphoadenylyl-sulfate reductase [Terriglobia bacterium]|nr:phosphoadenylyl-sulfate reductase [Terriglobia bacterium]